MAIIKPSKHLGDPVAIPVDPDSPNGLPLMIKAGDLLAMNMPLAKPVIHGLLSAGSTMVYGGASKTNKTYALMDMALSVATGKPWWGFKTEKGKVLYIDLEIQPNYYQSRLEDIKERKDPLLTKEDMNEVVVWNLRGKAKDISVLMPEMEMKLKGQEYSLIIIDPIYKMLGNRDENSAGDINSLMNDLDKLAVATGAAMVVGHHFSKGGQAGKESMDRISGSGVFARSPDTIVIITRHEVDDVFTVNVTLRNFKPIQPFCVTWEFPVMVRTEKYDPGKLKRPGMKVETYTGDQLLKILGDQELSTAEWAKQTLKNYEMSKRTFGVKKSALEDEGKVIKTENGKWKIAPEPKSIPVKDITPPQTVQDKEVQQQQKPTAALIEPKLTKPDKVVQQRQNTSAAFIEV
ncbi:AAA family ATPase [Prosthecobacter sp.]|uniref:AAA family ATPase n=1 Tax=Prosthecobacter sp. TaxID=1965333 RepID=UPI0037C7181D